MSKTRLLRPDYWIDEDVVELPVAGRMLLLALCNEADDQGLFRWKPRSIRLRYFPADEIDVEALLGALLDADLIRQYEADGSTFGALKGFGKHQKPKEPWAAHPLPGELDSYVALGDIPRPRKRSDRPAREFPRRPNATTDRRVDAGVAPGGRRVDDPVDAQVGDQQPPGGRRPSGYGSGYGSGGGSGYGSGGGEEPASAGPTTTTNPTAPTWVAPDVWTGWLTRAVDGASSRPELTRVPHRDLLSGVHAALLAEIGDDPGPEESAQAKRIRAAHDPVPEVLRWIDDLIERSKGKRKAYLLTALRGGPDGEGGER